MIKRKSLLIFTLSIFSIFIAQAQFGVKGGATLASIASSNSPATNKGSVFAAQIGIMYQIPIVSERFSVRPEFLFTGRGTNFSISQFDVELDLNYFELPIMAVYNIYGGALNIHAGPQFGFLSKVTYHYTNSTDPLDSFEDTNKDNYNSLDIGLGFGAGLQVQKVLVEFRYSIGFNNIDDNFVLDGEQIDINARNFNVQFNVGYFF